MLFDARQTSMLFLFLRASSTRARLDRVRPPPLVHPDSTGLLFPSKGIDEESIECATSAINYKIDLYSQKRKQKKLSKQNKKETPQWAPQEIMLVRDDLATLLWPLESN